MSETGRALKNALRIEPALQQDTAEIEALQRLTWLTTYPNDEYGISIEDIRVKVEGEHGELIAQRTESWHELLAAGTAERATFVVRGEATILGFISPNVQKEQRRLGPVYVALAAQGQGIGSLLIRQSLAWHGRHEDIYLRAASYCRSTMAIYRHFGFIATGREVTEELAQLRHGKTIPQTEMVLRALRYSAHGQS